MNVRTLRRGVLVLAGVATLALAPSTVAQAGPEKAPAPSDGIVMVNGAGKTVTVPRTVLTQGKSSFAGSSGNGLTGKPADKTKTGGGFSADSVIGTDDRVQESDPYGYPWRAIAHLSTNQGGCTGFMLSRDVLVTAGHCVYHGGWVTSYRVAPGKNGSAEPYGSCSGGIADVWTTYNYISTGSVDYDYGLIKLTCDIGNTVGWFGWWYNTGENLVNQYFYVEGYPGDKPYGTNWWDGDYATQQTASRLFYWNDTAPGQSGSPIYHYNSVTPGLCGGWCVTGIHTTGVWDTAYNSGTRFNPDVMSFINYWVSQP
jgi:glutamyl endopeptidase